MIRLTPIRVFPRHTQPDASGWIRFAVTRSILFNRAAQGVLGERTRERDSRHPDQRFFARQTIFSDVPQIRFAVSRSILFSAPARYQLDEFIVPPRRHRWRLGDPWKQEFAYIKAILPAAFDPVTMPGIWQELGGARVRSVARVPPIIPPDLGWITAALPTAVGDIYVPILRRRRR